MNSAAFHIFVELTIHICIVGGQSQLARDLHTYQAKVWRWLHHSKQMPAEYVLRAEQLYGVSRHRLRSDIYPIESSAAPSRIANREKPSEHEDGAHRLSAGAK
ncbi:MAG: helix-turn-helix domain-containing protein [Sphingomonadaceae bacterium]|nr:helix-turn-helix domain-containing protein [Sphingomonadaceae bacterium]